MYTKRVYAIAGIVVYAISLTNVSIVIIIMTIGIEENLGGQGCSIRTPIHGQVLVC